MRYKRLGNTGLIVSELALGTNTFGGGRHEFWKTLGGLQQSEVTELVSGAVQAGINLFDTADSYSLGESEQSLGAAIQELRLPREEMVIATKIGGKMGAGPNTAGASRSHLLSAIDASLKRLGVDYVDICMLHHYDPVTPIEESLRALDRAVQDGKIRYLGCSNFAAWEAMLGIGISEREAMARFAVAEAHWSIATRELERDVVPFALDRQIGLFIWGPLLGGLLSGKFFDGAAPPSLPTRSGGVIPPVIEESHLRKVIDALREIARRHSVTAGQIALAWLLHQPATTSVIFGCRSAVQLRENLASTNIHLSSEDRAYLDSASSLQPPYGQWLVRGARRNAQEFSGR